jgi:cell division topological specificity factor
MNLAALFGRPRSASTAHHRLQVLLMHERCAGGNPDLIPALRESILAAIGEHVTVDPDRVRLKIERGETVSLLEIEIEIQTLRNTSGKGALPRSIPLVDAKA